MEPFRCSGEVGGDAVSYCRSLTQTTSASCNNPILEIVSQSQTTVQTVIHSLQTADRLSSLVQSKIGPVQPVRDF